MPVAAVAPAGPAQISYVSGPLPPPYASARKRARVVIGLWWAMIAVQALWVWPNLHTVFAWRHYAAYGEAAEEDVVLLEMTAMDLAGSVLAVLSLVLYVVAAVFWFLWVHRTYRNLPALGAEGLRFSPAWAVAYYFIPILNLFRPYQVMSETWRASDARYGAGADWKVLAAPALLGWWWALHLFSSVVNEASVVAGLRSEEPMVQVAVAWVDVGMLVVHAVLLLVEIRVVRGLTELQERRADAVGIVSFAAVARG